MRTGSWRRIRKVAIAFWKKKKKSFGPILKQSVCNILYTNIIFLNSIETIRNLKDQTEQLVHTSEHK